MGMFRVDIRISAVTGKNEQIVRAVVDEGSHYSVAPSSFLEEIGVIRAEARKFGLKDGIAIDGDMGYATLAVSGRKGIFPVVFGPDGVEAVLGQHTLSELHLEVDYENEVLVKVWLPRLGGLIPRTN